MKIIYTLLCIVFLFCFAGCIHKYPHGEEEPGLQLVWQSAHPEDLTDICLWIFGADSILKEAYRFANLEEARKVHLPVPSEQITLVAVTCPETYCNVTAKTAESTLTTLLVALKDASSNPPHLQTGKTEVAAGALEARITLVRVLSELRFTIKNVPPEVIKIQVKVLNSACGFYPGINKLDNAFTAVILGEIAPRDGLAVFPLCRLMPVIPMAGKPGTAGQDTRITVTMSYADGTTSLFEVEAPTLENNGSYEVQSVYEWYRKDLVLSLNEINGWKDSGTVDGGMLCPSTPQ